MVWGVSQPDFNEECIMYTHQVCTAHRCVLLEFVAHRSFWNNIFLRRFPKLSGRCNETPPPMLVSGRLDMRLLRQERARRAADSCLQGHKLYKSSFIHSGRFMEAWPLEIKTQYAKEYPWKRRHCQLSEVVSTQLFTIPLHSSPLQRDVKQRCAAALAMRRTMESSPSQDLNIKRASNTRDKTPKFSLCTKMCRFKGCFFFYLSPCKQQLYPTFWLKILLLRFIGFEFISSMKWVYLYGLYNHFSFKTSSNWPTNLLAVDISLNCDLIKMILFVGGHSKRMPGTVHFILQPVKSPPAGHQNECSPQVFLQRLCFCFSLKI